EKQMKKAAADLNFEAAAELRDKMTALKIKLKELEDDERKEQRAQKQ
ncbi:MAG: UvrB/UvrC motif-containing protein, partial [Suilimivivens sp.]